MEPCSKERKYYPINPFLLKKITCFNRSSPTLIAIGSTNSQLSVLTFPALEDQYPPITYDGDEIYDTDFDDSGEMVSSFAFRVYTEWLILVY